MKGNAPSTESILRSLAEIDFTKSIGPVPHAVRFYDSRDVESHVAAMKIKDPSAEESWA